MKKALVILLSVAMMFCFSATAFATSFNDLGSSSQVAKDSIAKIVALGIAEGYDDGGFHPAATITRAEFAKMAVIAAGLKDSAKQMEGTNSAYSDVKAGVWYTGWINVASAQGYVKGYEDGTYGPNNTITYAEVTTVLMRLLGYNDNLTGPWPINYINQATKIDALDDVENFSANSPATRSDVAIMLANILDCNMQKWNSDDNEFQDKTRYNKDTKADETYTLLDDAFDSVTDQYYVSDVEVSNAEKGKYKITVAKVDAIKKAAKTYTAQNGDSNYQTYIDNIVAKSDSKTFDCDTDTAVSVVDPYALAGREVTLVSDNDNYANYIQVDDKLVKVAKAEEGKTTSKIKLDGVTWDVAAYASSADINNTFDSKKTNETGYALINDDDEVVVCGTDIAEGVALYGQYYLVTETSADNDADATITLNDNGGKGILGDEIDASKDDVVLVKDGARVYAKDIKAGDMLVAYDMGNNKLDDVEMFGVISGASVKGAVTAHNGDAANDGSIYKATIGGTKYAYTTNTQVFNTDYEYQDNTPDWDNLSSNKDEVTIWKDATNAIGYMIDESTGTSDKYAVLTDMSTTYSKFNSYNGGYKVDSLKVVGNDGKAVTLKVKDKEAVQTAAFNLQKGEVFTYELNSDNEIKSITLMKNVAKAYNCYDSMDVSNDKYVKVNGTNRVIKDDAVLLNVEDDIDVSLLTKANILSDDTVDADVLYDDDNALDFNSAVAGNQGYLWVVLDNDGKVKFMAITNYGGSTTQYGVVDDYYTNDGDKYVTFEGSTKEYQLDDDAAAQFNSAALKNNAIQYKLSGDKVKDIVILAKDKTGPIASEFNAAPYKATGVVDNFSDDLVTLKDNAGTFQVDTDTTYILNDAGDLGPATSKDVKSGRTVHYILDATDSDHPAEVVIITK